MIERSRISIETKRRVFESVGKELETAFTISAKAVVSFSAAVKYLEELFHEDKIHSEKKQNGTYVYRKKSGVKK
jgi:uncharacterized protein YaaN involved in tellurite resistance